MVTELRLRASTLPGGPDKKERDILNGDKCGGGVGEGNKEANAVD